MNDKIYEIEEIRIKTNEILELLTINLNKEIDLFYETELLDSYIYDDVKKNGVIIYG